MKQIIFLLMLISSAYAQDFYLSDLMLKGKAGVFEIVKPKAVTPYSVDTYFEQYGLDNNIIVAFEKNQCTYAEMTCSMSTALEQAKYILKYYGVKESLSDFVVFEDKKDNMYILSIVQANSSIGNRETAIYLQLVSALPKK